MLVDGRLNPTMKHRLAYHRPFVETKMDRIKWLQDRIADLPLDSGLRQRYETELWKLRDEQDSAAYMAGPNRFQD